MGLKEVEDILRDVDLNGDGLVDFEGKLSYNNYLFKGSVHPEMQVQSLSTPKTFLHTLGAKQCCSILQPKQILQNVAEWSITTYC